MPPAVPVQPGARLQLVHRQPGEGELQAPGEGGGGAPAPGAADHAGAAPQLRGAEAGLLQGGHVAGHPAAVEAAPVGRPGPELGLEVDVGRPGRPLRGAGQLHLGVERVAQHPRPREPVLHRVAQVAGAAVDLVARGGELDGRAKRSTAASPR